MPFDIPDNYDIWRSHQQRQDDWLESLPVCCECMDPIQQEKAVNVEGRWYCSDCELDAWAAVRRHFLEDVALF